MPTPKNKRGMDRPVDKPKPAGNETTLQVKAMA